MRRALGLFVFGVAMVAASPGRGCSVGSDYRVPTTLELVAIAETIVVAEVDGQTSGAAPIERSVLATPTLLLKGNALPGRVELTEAVYAAGAGRPATRSDRRELRDPNPDALMGGCVRYLFEPGMKLLLFLKRDDRGRLVPYRSSFSRDSEDVDGPDSLWVKAIREYVAIAALPKGQRRQRLESRAAELRGTGDPDGAALARDLDTERTGQRLPPVD